VKRSEALQSLSRDHHQALVVAQRLRGAQDAGEAAATFLDFWRESGQRHFRIEEEVLLPQWALLGSVDDAAAARLSREHLTIRSAALAIEAGAPDLEQLRALGGQLAAHVRFEERVLFERIEKDLDGDDLERLARVVSNAEQQL
jgi:hemerythrin-like domain-containing protein